MSTGEKRQAWKDVLGTITERIRWAGNLYGSDWRRELAFLEPAGAAVTAAVKALPRPASELPPSGVPVLVQFSGTSGARSFDRAEAVGRHFPEGWELEYMAAEGLVVHQWAFLPDFD